LSGITSNVGLISGINSGSIIDQLISLEARPRTLVQRRIVQLQTRQTAFLDLNNLLGNLRTAARSFNLDNVFSKSLATSSSPDTLTATSSPSAPIGQYTFLVDRLVSSQQLLSRGFADRDLSAVGATSFTFEPPASRLDRDTELSELNGGAGVRRGELRITDRSGATTAVDLSRVATVNEVLDAINASGAQVRATVQDDRVVLRDTSGLGSGTISVGASNIAADLGLSSGNFADGRLTGSSILSLNDSTSIRSLNDGLGIRTNTGVGVIGPDGVSSPDFRVTTRDGQSFNVDIGEIRQFVDLLDDNGDPILDAQGQPRRELRIVQPEVSTIGQLRARIEEQTQGTLSVEIVGRSLRIVDTTGGTGNLIIEDISGAAADFGIVTDPDGVDADSINTATLMAGINSRLTRFLGGGSGLAGDGQVNFTLRDGSSFSVENLNQLTSFSDIINAIESASAGKVTASLDQSGNRLVIRDTTGGTGPLIITGTEDDDTAAALGIATVPAGVFSSTRTGERLQRQWVGQATLLRDLDPRLAGTTGRIRITDSSGQASSVNIGSSIRTVGDLLDAINRNAPGVNARINDNGDGIVVEARAPASTGGDDDDDDDDDGEGGGGGGAVGGQRITITDDSGFFARRLNIAGTSKSSEFETNRIDGSFERTIEFNPATDTLDDVVRKINDQGLGLRASIVSDGSAGNRFRINFRSDVPGLAGAFTIDDNGFGLNTTVLSRAQNARVFFGSEDPASAVLISSTANTLDNTIPGVTIDLKAVSQQPVNLTVSRNVDGMIESVNDFVAAFNSLVGRIDTLSKYNPTTEQRGALLGDSTTQQLRQALFSTIQSPPLNVSGGFNRLLDVGIKFGSGGRIELDAEKLRAAIENDPQSVADLFGARVQADRQPIEISPGITTPNTATAEFTTLGVAERIAQLAERYTDSVSGVFTQQNRSIDSQISDQRKRIAFFDTRLAARRVRLENDFAVLERTLSQLQGQQSALGSITSFNFGR